MAEGKLKFKDKRWSLHGMTALVTGGSRGIGHAIAQELAEFGAAVNNAATCVTKNIIDYSAEDISTTMGTNFESGCLLCQFAYPLMKASGYGSIVFVSSISGLKALLYSSVYATSKALEWAKDNIRANAVAPGPVKTLLLESITKPAEIS
ncbi:hypothetical protein VNO77_20376 [Canavalia gladiata]|uniref:Uncharacterized protein n=1 Tax=Canavalia gladiata TaxID=3824 RepID=A0AAN9QJA5_CANGL